MDSVAVVRRLFSHLRWADERALEALRAAGAPAEAALRTYAHILAAEHVWLSRLREQPPTVAIWPTLDLEECARLARANADGYDALLDGLAADDLDREVAYRNSTGQSFHTALGDILLQVATHGSYHRGQVALLLRQGGAEPQATDYIVFVRAAAAAGAGG
jgi:uncharacterized damage-inducible protein DinB